MCAVFYGLLTAVLLGLTAGVAQALGKLSLDALIQRDIPERVRTSAFARSETLLQLSWVIGGFVGIALPLVPGIGLGVLAALMILWTGFVCSPRPPRAAATAGPRPRGPAQSVQLVGQPAQQLRGRLRRPRVGVPAVAVAVLDALEQPDQVLDDPDHVLGLLALGRPPVGATDGGASSTRTCCAWSPLRPGADAELDPGAGLERGVPAGSAEA